jgi:hypothetical protein
VITRRPADFDQRSASERAADERYSNFLIHFDDEEKRKRYRPRWQDAEAVVGLFQEEVVGEWLQDCSLPDSPSPHEEAIEKAKQKLQDLIRGKRKKRGERGPASKHRRFWTNSVHVAVLILPGIEDALRMVYPEQSSRDIRDRALLVAEDMTGAKVKTITNYLSRPKKDRRRLV